VAARAGIRPGDALLMVEGQPVQSVAQARRLIQGAADGVAVLIQRDDGRFFVGLKPAARMG
jgi:serine protease Do